MPLTQIASAVLNDAKVYLNAIPSPIYTKKLDLLLSKSIGQHTACFVEHFQCLLRQTNKPNGLVNYDKRQRDDRLAMHPWYAYLKIEQMMLQLQTMDHIDMSQTIVLQSDYDHHDCIRVNLMEVDSTYQRELVYNIEYVTYHLSIIKMGLKIIAPHIILPPTFGVAPQNLRVFNMAV